MDLFHLRAIRNGQTAHGTLTWLSRKSSPPMQLYVFSCCYQTLQHPLPKFSHPINGSNTFLRNVGVETQKNITWKPHVCIRPSRHQDYISLFPEVCFTTREAQCDQTLHVQGESQTSHLPRAPFRSIYDSYLCNGNRDVIRWPPLG